MGLWDTVSPRLPSPPLALRSPGLKPERRGSSSSGPPISSPPSGLCDEPTWASSRQLCRLGVCWARSPADGSIQAAAHLLVLCNAHDPTAAGGSISEKTSLCLLPCPAEPPSHSQPVPQALAPSWSLGAQPWARQGQQIKMRVAQLISISNTHRVRF